MQKRNSKGQFMSKSKTSSVKTKPKPTIRYFGNQFGDIFNELGYDYVLAANSDLTKCYIYAPGQERELTDFSGNSCECGEIWQELNIQFVKDHFLDNEAILVPVSWGELEKIVEENTRLENYKSSFKDYIVESNNTEKTKIESLTIGDIKIGSLYYNLAYQVVERVIDVQGRLVYTSYHKMECNPFSVNSFRKATQEEVDNYLKESEEIKG